MTTMRSRQRWAGLAVAGLAVACLGWWAAGTAETPLPGVVLGRAAAPQDPSIPPRPAARALPLPARMPMALDAAEHAPACPLQGVTLVQGGQAPERRCAAPTRTHRNGEMTVHEVEGSGGPPGWKLRIEAVGGQVHRVTWTAAGGERHGCVRDEGGCAGVVLSEGEGPAGRSIVLDNTLLIALPPQRPKGLRAADVSPAMFEPQPGARPLRLSAVLSTRADAAAPPLCAAPALTVVSSLGGVTSFCGEPGNEQASLPEGGELIGLLAYQGPPLRIHLGTQQQILRVELGPLACEGSACSGAAIETVAASPPDAQRRVSFAGTTLTRPGSSGSAEAVVIDGRMAIP